MMHKGSAADWKHWAATGCDLHNDCLTCPLPACRYDMPHGWAGRFMRTERLAELLASGWTITRAAKEMGLSRQAASRIKRERLGASDAE